MDNKIEIYTDGACSFNGSDKAVGGWGVVLKFGDREKKLSGRKWHTTNQRMELNAVIQGLKAVRDDRLPVVVYSDSAYVVNAINQKWYKKWQYNGWKTTDKKPVKNQDLWHELLLLYNWFSDGNGEIEFCHVKGHSGNVLNEKADWLAKEAILGNVYKNDN